MLVLGLVWIGFGAVRLAVVGCRGSAFFAGVTETSIGLVLPWALVHAGSDPARGGGPLATVIQAVLSLLIYTAVATALLQGATA
jgi:Mg/Co/Ni transporter MgtE